MQRCSIKLISSGMVLGGDVKGPGGEILAGAGSVLTDKHLTAFSTWGVATVMIDDSKVSLPEIEPTKLLAIKRAVARRFSGQAVHHPAIQELYRIAVERDMLAVIRQ